jgi:transposase InsO family protein
MVAAREAASLAERPLAETITAQQVEPHQLTIHADRGTSMTSKPVALLLTDLGVTKSYSRPKVSNDNPYSESQSRRSSTIRPSRSGSAASKTPAPSASGSSAGTTPSIAIQAFGC